MEWLFITLTVFLAGLRFTSMPIVLLFSFLAFSQNKFFILAIGLIASGFIWYNVYDLVWFLTLDKVIPFHILLISGVIALLSHSMQLNNMDEVTKLVMSSEIACIFLFSLMRWLGAV